MTRTRWVAALAALGLVPGFAVLAPGASAAGPPLSPGCATLHAGEASQITSSSGSIVIGAAFAAGEQVRFTITATGPSVAVSAPAGVTSLSPISGQPIRYAVIATGNHQFAITSSSGPVMLTYACGIPPTVVVTSPADGATYGVGDSVSPSFQCVPGTNTATCSAENPGPVDTSTTGQHSYRVIATDSADLLTATTVNYTVVKRAQALHFTSPPITDAIVGYRYNYVVTAESSSGLPVVLTADPNTPACEVSPYPPVVYGNVVPDHAGPCTVFADQPGNDQYAPAQRISMTFQIGRESTDLVAKRASKGVLGLSATTFSADLHYTGWFGPGYGAQFPYLGQPVSFYVGGRLMCTATTVSAGDGTFFGGAIATCKAKIGLAAALKYNSYTAKYAGSRDYLPSTATALLR